MNIQKGDNVTFLVEKVSLPSLAGNQLKCQLSREEVSGIVEHIYSDTKDGSGDVLMFHINDGEKTKIINALDIVSARKNGPQSEESSRQSSKTSSPERK